MTKSNSKLSHYEVLPYPTFCLWLQALNCWIHTISTARVMSKSVCHAYIMIFTHAAEPPRITFHPQELNDAVQGESVICTIQATGTKPLSYLWQWKPVGSEEWQPCRAEWCNDGTLTIPSVQKSNEGSYCCIVSNCAGSQTSNPAFIVVGKCSSI